MARTDALTLGIDAVVVSLRGDVPLVLRVGDGEPRLPSGTFAPDRDRTLELAARRVLGEQVPLHVGYLEQLYTFGDRNRDPREVAGGPRMVSVGYLALSQNVDAAGDWIDWYRFFPWEDARAGRPRPLETIVPLVRAWCGDAPDDPGRELRARTAFGLDGAPWNNEAVLERYECLFELGAVEESPNPVAACGAPMALDHRRILATAIGRVRAKIKYRPVIFELLAPTFTLTELQTAVEALSGARLHAPNFRRLVEDGGIVERTGRRRRTSGRPAEIFRFRPEVLAERPDPGIAIR